jgi:effector-binding domain-containing protein
MRKGSTRRQIEAGLVFSLLVILSGSLIQPLKAQESPAAAAPKSAPDANSPATKPATPDPDSAAPGVPNDAAAEPIDIQSRPTAIFHGQAKWEDGFASLMNAQSKIKEALEKSGLKQTGKALTVFTQTDDSGFTYDAMLPLAEKPEGKEQLSDDVKFGSSPSGKAIKFQHRGSYDDIDSSYDLITAYLDEKGLEARNFFIEEYLTDLKSADDQNLAVDIYVFIK